MTLRELLREPIVSLSGRGTHATLPDLCKQLGLPAPDFEGSKRVRMQYSYDQLEDSNLAKVAEKFLRLYPPPPALRNRIQDMLWAGIESPEIPLRYRHELSRNLGGASDLYLNGQAFDELLEQLWILAGDPLDVFGLDPVAGLRKEINQHVFRNPEDWSAEYLFEKLGAFDASDRRFILFIEGLASARVRPDESAQRQFVSIVNEALKPCGVELRETGLDGGYPVFEIVWSGKGVKGTPKNIIFASPTKPDLRFRDAVNNDIEIVSSPDDVLVYDRPITNSGLIWQDLQDWWADKQNLSATQAKDSLYKRLLASLPPNSPPQRLVFTAYAAHFRSAVPSLPVLLPEVWLHWDPKTVKERGPAALLRFRMDFLMLLPNGVRVVIEVDGKHHYSLETGQSSPQKYGAMMGADRDLRLAGYDVYRFGATELCEGAEPLVADFFERLFAMHHVQVPSKASGRAPER